MFADATFILDAVFTPEDGSLTPTPPLAAPQSPEWLCEVVVAETVFDVFAVPSKRRDGPRYIIRRFCVSMSGIAYHGDPLPASSYTYAVVLKRAKLDLPSLFRR